MAAYTTQMTGTIEIPPDVLAALDGSFQIAVAVQDFMTSLGAIQASSDANNRLFTFGKILEIDSSQDASLLEYEDPESVPLAGSATTVTAAEYGRVVTTTSLADAISGGALGRQAAAAVGRDAARWQNAMALKAISAGTNVIAPGTDMTVEVINTAYTTLSMAGATKDALGYYTAILHPAQVFDLKNDAGPGTWTDVNKYSDPATVLRGEVGTFGGFRIIESPNVAPVGGVYTAVFFGANALAQGVAVPLSLRLTSSDKLARFLNYGWYTVQNFGIVAQEQVVVGKTTSSFGAPVGP